MGLEPKPGPTGGVPAIKIHTATESPNASKSAQEMKTNDDLSAFLGSASSFRSQPPVEIFKLTRWQRLLAGSGHVLNDLCASLWFTYLLLYLQKVVKFNDAYAAGLLFWGQLVDGVATPLVGYGTDHVNNFWPCPTTYGRCKSWHLLGIILVMLSFPFIFSPCLGYSFSTDDWSQVEDWIKAIYYAPFIAIFQIGWACTQISHLALIPKLTPDDLIRTEILSMRYAFTVGANITVFILTWIFLTGMGKHENCSVGTHDSSNFSYIALISVGIGIVFSILFHWCVVEKSDLVVKRSMSILYASTTENTSYFGSGFLGLGAGEDSSRRLERNRTPIDLQASVNGPQKLLKVDNDKKQRKRTESVASKRSVAYTRGFSTKGLNTGQDKMRVKDWMRLPQFYMVACLYLSTRMAVNLSQTYMPLYVETSLGLSCGNVAVIPLIMYCSGFAISLAIKSLNKHLGRQLAYTIGAILIILGTGMILFMDTFAGGNVKWAIYVVAVFLGGGLAVILVTSLSITADLIGGNIESGAFVYGAMSFSDKIACGLGVVLINNLNPCKDQTQTGSCTANQKFYTDALGYSSGGSTIFAMVFIALMTIYIFKRSGSKRTQNTTF